MNKEKIRVLQVMDKCAIRGSPIHGVSRLLLTWWPAFENTNIEMSLCVLRGGDGTCSPFEKIGVTFEDLSRSKVDPRTILDLVKIIKRDNIDILHCHGYGATTFGRLAGLVSKTPVVVHEHMVDDNIPFYQELVDKMLSPLTSKGIAISEAVKTFMVEKRHISQEKMNIVYNTIPMSFFEDVSSKEKKDVFELYNLDFNKKLIGIIGRLDEIKGHKYLLHAAKEILSVRDDVLFVIVGDGELRNDLEGLVNILGLNESVVFLGHCSDVLRLTSLFTILVSASLNEGLGMSIIEAMAQGKPVLATAVGGVPELITHEKTGILVPAKDSSALALGINTLLENPDLARKYGEKAKIVCNKKFTSANTVIELETIYQSLIDKSVI